MKVKRFYKVFVGIDGFVLETHVIEAENKVDARDIAIRKILHPDKGFNYIRVERVNSSN